MCRVISKNIRRRENKRGPDIYFWGLTYIYTCACVCVLRRYIFKNKWTCCQLALEGVILKSRRLLFVFGTLSNWWNRHFMTSIMGPSDTALNDQFCDRSKGTSLQNQFQCVWTDINLRIPFWCLIRDPAELNCWVLLLTSSNNLLEGSTSCSSAQSFSWWKQAQWRQVKDSVHQFLTLRHM